MTEQSVIENDITMTGAVTVVRTDALGNEVERREIKNLVVTAGKNVIASRLVGTTSSVMSHMAIGSGQTSATAADTTLGTVLGTVTGANFTATNTAGTNSITYTGVFAAGTGTGTVYEAGIFNGVPGTGSMLCRTTFPLVTKQAGDSITITWVVTVN